MTFGIYVCWNENCRFCPPSFTWLLLPLLWVPVADNTSVSWVKSGLWLCRDRVRDRDRDRRFCVSGTRFLLRCGEKLREKTATGTTLRLPPPTQSSSISMETQGPGELLYTHLSRPLRVHFDLWPVWTCLLIKLLFLCRGGDHRVQLYKVKTDRSYCWIWSSSACWNTLMIYWRHRVAVER